MSDKSILKAFHPAVARWFARTFSAPTPPQLEAWPAIQAGQHCLIAAPTGSGKTLAAFLAAIDELVQQAIKQELTEQTRVVYVSPLKALSNDIAINLEAPLAGICAELQKMGHAEIEIRAAVRTGDTAQNDRQRMLRKPPHILVTTPESLYVLLGSSSGRQMLASVRSVIVDEIHAIAGSKRGSHLTLSLERLESLCQRRLVRIGLSATQKPIDEVARFLVGAANVDSYNVPDCAIIDSGHTRVRDLALELPPVPLEAVMSNDVWETIYDRLQQRIDEHRTTLIFVNTRRRAERVARHLGERLGKQHIAAHHGSLAKELRLDAEQRLKRGELKVLIATASLELGIDIGDVDLVCQLGSPHSIAAFLQRVGRSGHAVGATPKGRLFPLSRDDLVECSALLDCVRRGELDALKILHAPIDVLAQQIVAEVACEEWNENALYELMCRAWPYRDLARSDFDATLRMLADGNDSPRGARAGYVHRDAVHGRIKGRRNARLTALTSGGTIPDTADYTVVLEPQAITVGSVHEDFAIESISGDVFQLGNTSYRILRIERGKLRVEDAHGAAPNIPFWIAEAPGRSDELSFGVSRLREEIARCLESHSDRHAGIACATRWLIEEVGIDDIAAKQLVDYLARAHVALGALPTQKCIILERFFDESGGAQLVLHSPYGSRVNKAWGLALRKRFCRTFNFELQAAATEDAIVLSLSTSHSFPLIDVSRYLHSASAKDVLIQALLDAPLFAARWRWAATTALALPRSSGGARVAPQLQRMKAEDLLAAVFPDQVACLENIVGERQIPDHPLVTQTLEDCLNEAMDAEAWLEVLRGLEDGTIAILARDLSAPSPLAAEILSASPYAFLDDAPLEERRTQAVQARRWSDPTSAEDLSALDAEAIQAVREEAWPEPRDRDEMHEALMHLGVVTDIEAQNNASWKLWLTELASDARATCLQQNANALKTATPSLIALWCAAERLPQMQSVFPTVEFLPQVVAPAEYAAVEWTSESALIELIRARLGARGPVVATTIADELGLELRQIELALLALESEGYVIRGRFTPEASSEEWCERHLLARIHRYTLKRLRREIEPVEARDFMRFLFDWQRISTDAQARGAEALPGVLAQLEAFESAASAWESDVLPARIVDYSKNWLDDLCRSGRIVWTRIATTSSMNNERPSNALRNTPIVILPRRDMLMWSSLSAISDHDSDAASSRAQAVLEYLAEHGASFFDELMHGARLLKIELEEALSELVARGMIHSDSFAGLRALLVPPSKRTSNRARRSTRVSGFGIEDAGRWALIPARKNDVAAMTAKSATRLSTRDADHETIEHVARVLLRRYGVVCWRLLAREASWLPPWRELLRIYRQLEARGEIRGGRFIAGLSGEQFALPEAISPLRKARARERRGEQVVIAATDPLNLVGIVTVGARIASIPGSKILYIDGVPVVALVGTNVQRLAVDGDADDEADIPVSWKPALEKRTSI